VIEPYVISATLSGGDEGGMEYSYYRSGGKLFSFSQRSRFRERDRTPFTWPRVRYAGGEWVMPDGEIVRTGSLGAGLGWFSAKAPTGVRGIIRGSGTREHLGLTKIALKLFPWPGPQSFPLQDDPAYKTELPVTSQSISGVPDLGAWRRAPIKSGTRNRLYCAPSVQHVRPRPQAGYGQDIE